MKIIRCFLISIVLYYVGLGDVQAQKEDHVWLFGASSMNAQALGYQFGNTVLDFSDIEPLIYYDSLITMDFVGTNSSICDKDGNLLMYTNGMQIHGSNHIPIENGDTIAYSPFWNFWSIDDYYENGDNWLLGFPTVQGTLILPIDAAEDDFIVIYHIKKIGDNGSSYVSSLNYSLISRGEDSKLKITLKDEIVKEDILNIGQMHACRHANGRDWWLIQQNVEADSVFTYLISDQGIELRKTLEKEPREEVTVTSNQVVFSPNGELYVVANGQYLYNIGGQRGTVLRVFSFDRCQGELIETGTDTINNYGVFASVAFSPSGQYMYASDYYDLFQYDMHQEDWASSKKVIATYDGFTFQYTENSSPLKTLFGPMALGSDGRIYSVPNGDSRFLNVIEYPDEEGIETGVIQHKIMMPTENFRSVPNLPNYKLGPLEGSTCDTLGLTNYLKAQFRFAEDSTNYLNIRFTDISYFEPDEWMWDFGDGKTYDGQKPHYHEYEEEGVYHVCLTVNRGSESNKFCKTIYLGVTSNKDVFLTDNQVNIYPNPVDDYLNIEIRDYIPSNLNIFIYNGIGKIVRHQKMRSNWNQIEFHNMAKGVYHYTLVDDKGNTYSDSFVKI